MQRRVLLFATSALLAQCNSTPVTPPPQNLPGEQVCDPQSIQAYLLSFDPPYAVVSATQTRPVTLLINPDVCNATSVTFTSDNPALVVAPQTAQVDLRHASYDFQVQPLGATSTVGIANLTATMLDSTGAPYKNQDGSTATATIKIDVRPQGEPPCTDTSTIALSQSQPTQNGTGTLADASLGSTTGAFTRTDWLALPPFSTTVSCQSDIVTPDLVALTPAVSFIPTSALSEITPLRREIDFAIPINPANMPSAGRTRHVEVMFRNKMAQAPRPVNVANPRIEAMPDGNYAFKFSSPWFGEYQAFARTDAGTRTHSRHLTHRAVIGISMGGGGAATFGMHHHDEFDAIGPLGGPSDWSWLGWFVEHYALGGFCTAANPTCTLPAPGDYPATDTYMHTEDFNHWWYEAGNGNGGHFSRSDYEQIFTDLALMRNNPNGENDDPDQMHMAIFAAGPDAGAPWVQGDAGGLPQGTNCAFTLSPINALPDGGTDPFYPTEQQIQTQCAQTRCDPQHTFVVPSGYYDDEYNPDGSQQVISVCDGNQEGNVNNDQYSPYENTFLPPTPQNAYPLSLALAVDLNKNGVRDENEPVIRSGHEPWSDTGTDGLADAQEPGYDPVNNPDPNGDDYDPYINPTGTENDHRYQLGEPFQDVGLDGVANTAGSPFDKGEGDGVFTMASGLQNFLSVDPHSILRGWTNASAGQTTMSDDDLQRFSIWSDGGVRDLFNFAAVATHFEGALSTRRTSDGHALQPVAFYDNFNMLPGQDETQPDNFIASMTRWADLAASPSLRYGTVDATPAQISQGDGQHVGTGAQILYRLEAAFYFVAHQWPDADRLLTNVVSDNPETQTANVLCAGADISSCCEMNGHCEGVFTGTSSGRTGPFAVTLPPGYANEDNRLRNVRYPVVFVLHGYGQNPDDLEALQLISNNFMNDGTVSYERRLGKFIAVYVDGRCREGTAPSGWQPGSPGTPQGQPECIQGGFYLDSARPGGALFDTWFDELVQYVDQNYRTLPPTDVTVTD